MGSGNETQAYGSKYSGQYTFVHYKKHAHVTMHMLVYTRTRVSCDDGGVCEGCDGGRV